MKNKMTMKNKNKITGLAILLILIACLSCLVFTTQTKAQDKTISILQIGGEVGTIEDFSIIKGETQLFKICLSDKQAKNTNIEFSVKDGNIAQLTTGTLNTQTDNCALFNIKGFKVGFTEITAKSDGYTPETKFIGVQETPFKFFVTTFQEKPPIKVDFITSIHGGIPPYTCSFSSGELGFFITLGREYTKEGRYTETLYYTKPSNVVPYTATISCTDDFGQRFVKDISITVEAPVKEDVVIAQETPTGTCVITKVETPFEGAKVFVTISDMNKLGFIQCSISSVTPRSKIVSLGDSKVQVHISKTWMKKDIEEDKEVSCVIFIDNSPVSKCSDEFTVIESGTIVSTTGESDLTKIKEKLEVLDGLVRKRQSSIKKALGIVATLEEDATTKTIKGYLEIMDASCASIQNDFFPQINTWIKDYKIQSSSTSNLPNGDVIAIIGHAITGYGAAAPGGIGGGDTGSEEEAGSDNTDDDEDTDKEDTGSEKKEAETSTPTEQIPSAPEKIESKTIDKDTSKKDVHNAIDEVIKDFKEGDSKLDKILGLLLQKQEEGETTTITTPDGKDGKKDSELATEKNKLLKGLWNFTRIKGGPWQKGYLIGTWIYSTIQAGSYIRGGGTCFAEQPLPGTDYCEACNMPFAACSEKRCGILGSCKWVEVDDGRGGVCMPGICEPTSVPVITDMDVRFYIDNTKSWRNFTKIKPPCPSAPPAAKGSAACIKVGELVPYNASDIEIDINLNQHAKCRYIIDKHNASFEEMNDFKGNQFYPLVQSAVLDITNLELGENHSIYIKCEGSCGQTHAPGFDWNFIKFKFEEKPDELPPVIVKLVPDPTSQYLSSESTEETIEIWLDEAGFCKYSHIGTNDICGNNLTTNWTSGGMCPVHSTLVHNVKSFTCSKNKEQCCSSSGIGSEPTCYEKYDCGRCNLTINPTTGYEELNWSQLGESAELPELVNQIPSGTLDYMKSLGMTGIGKVFTYMFRCSDGTNIMHEENSYMYVIMTYPPFEMNITEPEDGSISYERVWNISVNTSRPTECRYTVNTTSVWQKWEDMEEIDDGFRTEHKGLTSELLPAHYTLNVRCRDSGGLEEQGSVEFTVLKDTTEPMIIRLYNWEDYLYIETNEKTDCVYGIVDCNYDFDDGMEMVGAMQYIHSAPWSLDNNYYVKCRDRWDNEPLANKCTAIISPYEVPEL